LIPCILAGNVGMLGSITLAAMHDPDFVIPFHSELHGRGAASLLHAHNWSK
jgi:hypothetical protein